MVLNANIPKRVKNNPHLRSWRQQWSRSGLGGGTFRSGSSWDPPDATTEPEWMKPNFSKEDRGAGVGGYGEGFDLRC